MSSNVVPVDEKQNGEHPTGYAENEKRASSDKQAPKEELGLDRKLSNIDPEELGQRLEASGVSDSYERKVYILNRVMNEHIGMGKVRISSFQLCSLTLYNSSNGNFLPCPDLAGS